MDASRFLKKLNQKGIAVVYLAILLVALLVIAALVIDFGFRHVVKSQLQNAADSAALAGIMKMKTSGTGGVNTNDTVQDPGRSEAVIFASKNSVVKAPAQVSNDRTNTLSDANDITVGRWNSALHSYSAGRTPINAIQVRTRRTTGSVSGPIDTFFGKILGIDNIDVKAEAIASLPARASTFIAICIDACPTAPFTSPVEFGAAGANLGATQFAWTSLIDGNATSSSGVSNLICNKTANEDVCINAPIYTQYGGASATLKNLESAMYDPAFDASNKQPFPNPTGSTVTGWNVIVPVTNCAAGKTTGWEPAPVIRYAKLHITKICSSGGGGGCDSHGKAKAPSSVCSGVTQNSIVIDSITCTDCSEKDNMPGLKPALVR